MDLIFNDAKVDDFLQFVSPSELQNIAMNVKGSSVAFFDVRSKQKEHYSYLVYEALWLDIVEWFSEIFVGFWGFFQSQYYVFDIDSFLILLWLVEFIANMP